MLSLIMENYEKEIKRRTGVEEEGYNLLSVSVNEGSNNKLHSFLN